MPRKRKWCFNFPPECLNALAQQLTPDLFRAIDLHIGLPDAFNLRGMHLITLGAGEAQCRIAPLHSVTPVAGRGDPQDFANRLDPVRMGGAGRRTFSRLEATDELRLGEKRAGKTQNFICLAQLINCKRLPCTVCS